MYQRYIYRVDPKRVNEFGTSQEMMEDTGTKENEDTVKSIEGKTDEKGDNPENKGDNPEIKGDNKEENEDNETNEEVKQEPPKSAEDKKKD